METNKITGIDSAYPTVIGKDTVTYAKGLTIRQQFAMAAMQGTVSNPEAMEMLSKKYIDGDLDSAFERIAQKSVKLADALINELNK